MRERSGRVISLPSGCLFACFDPRRRQDLSILAARRIAPAAEA